MQHVPGVVVGCSLLHIMCEMSRSYVLRTSLSSRKPILRRTLRSNEQVSCYQYDGCGTRGGKVRLILPWIVSVPPWLSLGLLATQVMG